MDQLNLYIVSPKDIDNMPYDQFLSVTVIAENESTAIKLARQKESPIWSFQHAFDELGDDKLKVERIGLNQNKIVSSSFLYG